MKAFIANLKHAVRNRETVMIGGGEFSPEELKEVAAALETLQAKTEALDEIAKMLESLPESKVGNSKVHHCMWKAKSALHDAHLNPRDDGPACARRPRKSNF